MWVKMFYFLRIFRETGYLVNMLVQVFREAWVFFLLYILIHMAFGTSFFILTDRDWGFFYSYMIGMGLYELDFSDYHSPTGLYLTFFFATVLVNIVMLNLLIAIVCVAYDKVI